MLASGLGLTETPADDQISLVRLMENFNRFILEQLQKESISNQPINNQPQLPIIEELFGSSSLSHSKCLSCKHENKRETKSFQYDLVLNNDINLKEDNHYYSTSSFSNLLKKSLKRENHTKAWCDNCNRYQLTEQKRELTSLPNILCINTAASKAV